MSNKTHIQKIKLFNFKRFSSLSLELDKTLNLLIGDNDSGKSTILLAIDIVLSGNRKKVESIGLETLFNNEIIKEFLAKGDGDRVFLNLPKLQVEVYFNEQNNYELNGACNSEGTTSDGLLFTCVPDDSLVDEINEVLQEDNPSFPFEYYLMKFRTFSDTGYTGYKKYSRHLLIDNTQISNEYATKSYIKTMYKSNTQDVENHRHSYQYRQLKKDFQDNSLKGLNDRLSDYSFSLKTNSKSNLTTDLTISEKGIEVENMGKGKQCFIRTEFALTKGVSTRALDVVLLEEPENHLSHGKMSELITTIQGTTDSQLLIATHNSLVSSRLDLRKSILLNSNSQTPTSLDKLPTDTANFFIKAPNNNILEFVLSQKVLLVEGDAEYMLVSAFFEKSTGSSLKESNVHVISVGGTSFKRYFDLAKLLSIRTAVIRDNDSDFQANCIDNYSEYNEEFLKVFFDDNNDKYTFEVAIYEDNKEACDEIFNPTKKTVQEFMLANKSRVAYELLDKKADMLVIPDYIKNAISWINE